MDNPHDLSTALQWAAPRPHAALGTLTARRGRRQVVGYLEDALEAAPAALGEPGKEAPEEAAQRAERVRAAALLALASLLDLALCEPGARPRRWSLAAGGVQCAVRQALRARCAAPALRGARRRGRRAVHADPAAGPCALRVRRAAAALEPRGGGAAALCMLAWLLGLAPCRPGAPAAVALGEAQAQAGERA
jgi:hypothetical protein